MKIRELYLKNFGKFSDKTFLIEDGIHVIYGENEFGKSTLYAFIRGMLFGMERARGRASKNDAFSRYEPWDYSNYYAGVLRFCCNQRNFRLERSFDKISRSSSLICEDDGEELSIEQGDLNMLLDGMTAELFDNTVAIGQLCAQPNQELAAALRNYAANYYETGNSEIDLQDALNCLKQKKKAVDTSIKQENIKKNEKRKTAWQECEYVQRDIDKLRREQQEVELKIKKSRVNIERNKSNEPDQLNESAKPKRNNRFFPLIIVLMILLTVPPFILVKSPWNYIASGVILLLDIVILLLRRLYRQRQIKKDGELCRREEKLWDEKLREEKLREEKLRWEAERIAKELQEKQVIYGNLKEHLEELEEVGDTFARQNRTGRALQMAQDIIMELSADIQKEFGNRLNQKSSEIIAAITDGKYTQLHIDEKLHMFLHTKEKKIPVEQVSRGTMEQIYFALRMAASDILYEEELPVILDDTFAFYDEHRLKACLMWLYKNKKQVILFTCQKREPEALEEMGIPYNENVRATVQFT